MSDEEFRGLCNTYGFALSRSLRELLEMATAQAVISERQSCASVCDAVAQKMHNEGEGPTGYVAWVTDCAASIRARGRT